MERGVERGERKRGGYERTWRQKVKSAAPPETQSELGAAGDSVTTTDTSVATSKPLTVDREGA